MAERPQFQNHSQVENTTEWEDIQRKFGNRPPKEKVEPSEFPVPVTSTQGEDDQKDLADLEEDDDDLFAAGEDSFMEEYRQKRLEEMKAAASKARFGEVRHISKADYQQEVNNAGADVWVILTLYEAGLPECELLLQLMTSLASKFPSSKFLKIRGFECIPNYPGSNLPTVFIYHNDDLKEQFIGLQEIAVCGQLEELEWTLGQVGAVPTTMKEAPKSSAHLPPIAKRGSIIRS